MFALQEEYLDPKTKKTIPLLHKKKVRDILVYAHEKMQPILKLYTNLYTFSIHYFFYVHSVGMTNIC